MTLLDFFAQHPTLNFGAYLVFTLFCWAVSMYVYEKVTPYREWELIAAGNKAAAFSMGGVAIGLALPLCSLVFHAQGLGQMGVWAAVSMASQLILWLIFSRTAFRNLKESIVGNVESVGLFLGAVAIGLGAIIASCVS